MECLNSMLGMLKIYSVFFNISHYAKRMDCMIWKIAEPHTTNIKRASNHGPTG